ncbi:MAG: LamG-like jellyroll fold domain-containing protein [Armatimonadota bacterium]
MRAVIVTLVIIGVVCGCTHAQEEGATVQLAEPFRTQYAGEDATGAHVVALWQFDRPDPAADLSGNGHALTLRGAEFVEGGRFGGGALRSYRGWPDVDDPHQARAAADPRLSPQGPFTVEMWLQPAEELPGYPEAFLLDCKYVDDLGYQLILTAETSANTRRLRMNLGLGDRSESWQSDPFTIEPGVWRHVAFTYDGAGTGSFFVDGAAMGSETKAGLRGIAPARHALVIGDRVGSLYHGFPGLIDQVRISAAVLEFRPAAFELVSGRTAYLRMEQAEPIRFALVNKLRETLSGAMARFTLGGMPAQVTELPAIASGERHLLEFAVDTSLRPDDYALRATVEVPGDPPFTSTEQFAFTIVPRPLPHRMPVVMWGGESGKRAELQDIGFTHYLGLGADLNAIWEAQAPVAPSAEAVAAARAGLDEALRAGMRVVSGLSPGRWARGQEDYRRISRDGERLEDVCALFPRVQQFCHDVGVSMSEAYGDHPGYDGALLHTEVRGESAPCFHDHDRAAFREFAGYDIPEQVRDMRGVHYEQLDGFPTDRVIPDDYPLYVYYRWLWKVGDGWNALHTQLDRGLKEHAHEGFWTFHDPAVRVAHVYGSGGEVDYISQWTYSYPDPIRIGLATEELLCMAGGSTRPDQQVMKMTQIIWYRSQTAPEPGEQAQVQTGTFADQDVRPQGTGSVDTSGRYLARWEREIPDARFITIAPMHLREAFWTKIARPIKGIMYHGIGSLLPDITGGSYQYTHPETRFELKRLCETLVEPLGPTLVQVPGRQSDVGFLESFASEIFARKGTYGWNGGWTGEMWLICLYAGLQPQVLYDETIEQEGLDAYRVLVLPDCDVLTESVARAVQAFQARGGIVVGDENLCPAITPDILVRTHARDQHADLARAVNIEKALALRQQLDPHYKRHADSSTPDVIPYVRSYGSTDYLFAVNDRREFGDYVGHHGLVMENGLPTDATLTIARGGHVYDLVGHQQVAAQAADGGLSIDWHFGPCEGRVFMVTQRAIQGIRVSAPEQVAPGGSATIAAEVLGDDGQPLDAIVPVRVDIIDPHGRAAEFSGWYGARDGRVQVEASIAANDVPGLWRIQVQELASGRTADAYMRVGQ